MSWRRVGKSLLALLAHALLFSFTLLLVLKLHHAFSYSWWLVFAPLWLFHSVVARGRFSLPAPAIPHDRNWAPFHTVMASPLLVAFELLLCIHLDNSFVVNLKIVFMPLLIFEIAILVDNIRMCRALMPGDDESMSDEVIWETLPRTEPACICFLVQFELRRTSIAECFAFLVCTKWYNPAIHRNSHLGQTSSSSMSTRYLDWNRGLVVSTDEDMQQNSGMCSMQDIGGHVMKIPFIGFQIMLFMYLEGTPPSARNISSPVLFSPLLLLQGAGVVLAAYRLIEKIVILIHSEAVSGRYFDISSKVVEFFGFLHRGSLLGWWSIDEGSREEQARLYCSGASGYNTFSPDSVKKMPKSDLVEEIWRLQAAVREQTEITQFSQQEFERLQNEKILCRVCFEEQINIVLLPCRHHVLCSTCCEKCKRCPICRVSIEERLPVYDV
ncbi:hypothetical protein GOBAR_AA33513 [Gossypium barbadense]|uniref:RING-type domain-containing protein n=1 Tax=Gossypium barbadense TaxID=3634 RepID=A0A2P5W7Y8_GOSBA|nr:hypothetical protein GOBAR_AA33513 [Gossypium barbadense]